MLGKLKDAEKEIEKFRAEKVLQAAAGLAESAKDVKGVAVVTGPGAGRHRRPTTCAGWSSTCAAASRAAAPRWWPCSRSTTASPLTVIATNEPARERGLKAGDLVRTAAKALGGGGGGKTTSPRAAARTRPRSAVDAVQRLSQRRPERADRRRRRRRPAAMRRAGGSRRRRGRPDRGRLVRPRRDPGDPGRDGARPGRSRRLCARLAAASSRSTSRSRSSSASPLPQRGRGAGRGQGPRFRTGAGRGHRPGPGPAGRRADDHRDGRQGLRASGVKSKKGRSVVDQAAAVIILQSALEAERVSGKAPGESVEVVI